MFIVKRNGNRSIRDFFKTYDQARCAVRKLIRKRVAWDFDYSNPTLNAFGYKIQKVRNLTVLES